MLALIKLIKHNDTPLFRFENLEVWKVSLEIGHRISDLADRLEAEGKSFYADKLRERSCAISGALAGGSAVPSKIEFSEYVGRARSETLELANLAIFYSERELISEEEEAEVLSMLKRESKMLENFRQSLEKADRPDNQQVA